jgi:hypothetical protein
VSHEWPRWFRKTRTVSAVERKIQAAAAAGKWVLLEFYGD